MKIFVTILLTLMLTSQNSHAGKFSDAKSYVKNWLGLESPAISQTSKKEVKEKAEFKTEEKVAKKKLVQSFKVVDSSSQTFKCDTRDEYPLCQRKNPETGELEYLRFFPRSWIAEDAKRVRVDRKDLAGSPIWLTIVDSSTSVHPGVGSFIGMHWDEASSSFIKGEKPTEKIAEEKVEVPEPSIKGELVTSTPTASVEVQGNLAASANMLPPETEAVDVKPQASPSPALEEVQKASTETQILSSPLVKLEQEEPTAKVEQQEVVERPAANLVVVNNTSKDLQVTVHVYGNGDRQDVDMGILGAGERMPLLCSRDFISLTFKGSWGFRKDLRPSCGKDPQKTYGVLVDPNGPRPAS